MKVNVVSYIFVVLIMEIYAPRAYAIYRYFMRNEQIPKMRFPCTHLYLRQL